jgi:hypothetical protein
MNFANEEAGRVGALRRPDAAARRPTTTCGYKLRMSKIKRKRKS